MTVVYPIVFFDGLSPFCFSAGVSVFLCRLFLLLRALSITGESNKKPIIAPIIMLDQAFE